MMDMGIEISIHALCEEGDDRLVTLPLGQTISIHALCEEGDRQPPPPRP